MPMRHSFITSKIRDELEQYDELPAHRRPIFNDDDDDDTYSANDGHRYRHRKLPPVPSTAHRIINFVTTLKRQLQKNFHDIRSRILIEAMSSNVRHRRMFHVKISFYLIILIIFFVLEFIRCTSSTSISTKISTS
jgi:hypothetical protein